MKISDKVKKFFDPCITVIEYKKGYYRPDTLRDRESLKFCTGYTYFTEKEYDSILTEVSKHGYSLEVIEKIKPYNN